MNEKKLELQVEEFSALAKENPNIDVASLMLNAIKQKDNLVSTGWKRWAYFISIGLPPFGLLFALKFYVFSGEEDAKHVANVCVILTAISVALFWIVLKTMLSGSGVDLQQIQTITPKQIQDTLQ